MPLRSQRSWSLLLAAIPEDDTHTHDSDDKLEYRLDLGSGALESRCPTPQPSFTNLRRPLPRRPVVVGSRKGKGLSREKEAERDCGICFELAVAPVRTHCCSQLICGEHIASYLNDPRADGRCPACHAPPPSFTYASLGHPAHAPKDIPRAPPPSRAPTPPPIELPASAAPYAAYPSTPVRLVSTSTSPTSTRLRKRCPSPSGKPSRLRSFSTESQLSSSTTTTSSTQEDAVDDAWVDDDLTSPTLSPTSRTPTSLDETETEDDTSLLATASDSWTLPLLIRARALQTRRHAAHPFASVVGFRGVVLCALRIGVWVCVVGVLARKWQDAHAVGGGSGVGVGERGEGW